MKLRIRRYNLINWTVERYKEAGQILPNAAVTREGWTVTGYHTTLERACLDALTELVPVGAVGQEILDSLAAGQEAIGHALRSASSDFLAGKVSEVMEIETPRNPPESS